MPGSYDVEGKRAAIYARFSSDQQNPKSIEAQERECRDFAEREGIEVVRVYADAAKSGMREGATRAQFTELMCDLEEADRGFEVVLVWESFRLTRLGQDAVMARAALKRNKVRLISVTQPAVGGEEPEDRLLDWVLMGVGEYDSITKGRNSKRGTKHRLLAGYLVNAPVFGYRRVVAKRERRGRKTVEFTKPEIHPEESRAVRLIFDLYDKGIGASTIADRLNDEGHRTRADKTFTRSAVATILDRADYTGVKTWNKKQTGNYRGMTEVIIIEDFYPQLIDHKLWARVRARRERNKENFGKSYANRTQYLLSGLVSCSCGERMNGRTTRRGTFCQYECKSISKTTAKHGCGARRWGKDDLEDQVVSQVASEVLTTATVRASVDELRAKSAADVARVAGEVRKLEAEAAKVDAAVRRWFQRVDEGEAEYSDVKPHIDQLTARATRLREQALAEGRRVIEPTKIPDGEALDRIVEAMRDELQSGDLFRRRGLIQALVKSVTLRGDEAQIAYRIPLGGPGGGGGGGKKRPPKEQHPPGLTGGCTVDALAPQDGLEPPT